jgi:hypothetical protein
MSQNKYGYVYKVVHVPTGRYYIGQRICNKTGKVDTSYWGSGIRWKNILKKYPREEFQRIILEFADSAEHLNLLEKTHLSNLFEIDAKCMNLQSGGDQIVFSEETKRKMSESNKGENNGMFGKQHSQETREKIKNRQLGVKESEETKQKLSAMRQGVNNSMYGTHRCGEENPMFGKNRTDAVKQRISECNLGEKNGMYGKKMSESAKRTIGLKHAKKIMCVETGVIYESAREASRLLGVNSESISQHLHGKFKTAGGFHWVFVKEQEA